MNDSHYTKARKVLMTSPGSDELRDRRFKVKLESRKKRRDDEIHNRRSAYIEDEFEELLEDIEMMDVSNVKRPLIGPEVLKLVYSANVYEQISGVRRMARSLWRSPKEAISEMARQGLVIRLLQLLQSGNKVIQFEASHLLGDMSLHPADSILPLNIIQVLSEVLATTVDDKVRAEILMVIGNIAVESTSLRDRVLASIAPKAISKVLMTSNDLEVLRHGAFALSAFCVGSDPLPDPEKTASCIPVLARLIQFWDSEVTKSACVALIYLCENGRNHIQQIVDANVCQRLSELLYRSEHELVATALKVLGKIACGNELQTQAVIDSLASYPLRELMNSDRKELVLDSCWVISNIAVGSSQQIQSIIDTNIFPTALNLLKSEDCRVVSEAAWIFRQAMSTRRTTEQQMFYFISIGCVEALCGLLSSKCCEILCLVVHALNAVVVFGFDIAIKHINVIQQLASVEHEKLQKYVKRFMNNFSDKVHKSSRST